MRKVLLMLWSSHDAVLEHVYDSLVSGNTFNAVNWKRDLLMNQWLSTQLYCEWNFCFDGVLFIEDKRREGKKTHSPIHRELRIIFSDK